VVVVVVVGENDNKQVKRRECPVQYKVITDSTKR
jgi:hypothetical protein